jgi:hypothetical protein
MFTIQTPQSIDLLAHDPANPPPLVPAPYVYDPSVPYRPPVPPTAAQQAELDKEAKEAPKEPEHHGTIRFDHEGVDVSKCRMIITRDDKVFTYTFNTGGNLLSSTYEDDKTREAQAAQVKAAKEAEDKAAAETEKERLAKLQATGPLTDAEKARLAAPVEHKRETEPANQLVI